MPRVPLFLTHFLPFAIHVVVFRSLGKERKAVIRKSRKTNLQQEAEKGKRKERRQAQRSEEPTTE